VASITWDGAKVSGHVYYTLIVYVLLRECDLVYMVAIMSCCIATIYSFMLLMILHGVLFISLCFLQLHCIIFQCESSIVFDI